MLPSRTALGLLSIVEVYETHDIPRLFLAVNNLGLQFVALWIDYDEETETWLYLPVSAARVRVLRAGEIDLRSAFRESETGYVWRAVAALESGEWRLDELTSSALEDEQLPEGGERLALSALAPPEIRTGDLADLAIGGRRDALAVALYYARNYGYQAPVRELGHFMGALQDQLDVLAANRREKFGPGGSVPLEILQQTQVVFDSTYPSSFGMRLVASLPPDLAGESLVAVAIQDLMVIISLTDQQLPTFLKEAHGRVAVKYRKLLESLLDNEAGVSVAWQRPGKTSVSRATMSFTRVQQVYDIVSEVKDTDSVDIEFRGILTGVNTRTRSYEITSTDGKKRYAGKIANTAMSQASAATMSQLYDASIRETIEVEMATGAEKSFYQLIGLRKV